MLGTIEDSYKLFGSITCPYSAFARIVANESEVQYVFIEVKISTEKDKLPTGHTSIPVLEIPSHDSTKYMSESTVICDHFNEEAIGTLYPNEALKEEEQERIKPSGVKDALAKALFFMATAESKTDVKYTKNMPIIEQELQALSRSLTNQPFFHGEQFSMVDAAYAPIFRRIKFFKEKCRIDLLTKAEFGAVRAWSDNILDRANVKSAFESIDGVSYDHKLSELLDEKNSFLLKSDTDEVAILGTGEARVNSRGVSDGPG